VFRVLVPTLGRFTIRVTAHPFLRADQAATGERRECLAEGDERGAASADDGQMSAKTFVVIRRDITDGRDACGVPRKVSGLSRVNEHGIAQVRPSAFLRYTARAAKKSARHEPMTSPQPDDRPSCRLAQLSLEFRAELLDRVEGRRADGTGSAARLDDFTPTFFMMTTSPRHS
jgi:hypothetical protein